MDAKRINEDLEKIAWEIEKDELLDLIGQHEKLSTSLGEACSTFVANQAIPLNDRWEVFQNAPNRKEENWVTLPEEEFEEKFGKEIEAYEVWAHDKYQTVDVVDRLNDWDIGEWVDSPKGWMPPYNHEEVLFLKNWYMEQYIKSWMFDW